MSESDAETDGNKRHHVLAEGFFAQSGKPTMELLLDAKMYIDHLCEMTGRSYFRVLDDVVRSIYAYKTLQFKKDYRFWLYKNGSNTRRELTNDECNMMDEINEISRSALSKDIDINQSDASSDVSNPAFPGDDRATVGSDSTLEEKPNSKPLTIKEGCPVHRKDCRTWRYKTSNKGDGTDVICEWYKKYTRWKAVGRGRRARFSSLGTRGAERGDEPAPVPAMKSATVVDYADINNIPDRDAKVTDIVGAPLYKKSGMYNVTVDMDMAAELASSDSENDMSGNQRPLNTSRALLSCQRPSPEDRAEVGSDGSQSSGSGTDVRALREMEEADELLAIRMYQAELNGNPDELAALQTEYLDRDRSRSHPDIDIQECAQDDTERTNLNSNQRRITSDISDDDY